MTHNSKPNNTIGFVLAFKSMLTRSAQAPCTNCVWVIVYNCSITALLLSFIHKLNCDSCRFFSHCNGIDAIRAYYNTKMINVWFISWMNFLYQISRIDHFYFFRQIERVRIYNMATPVIPVHSSQRNIHFYLIRLHAWWSMLNLTFRSHFFQWLSFVK